MEQHQPQAPAQDQNEMRAALAKKILTVQSDLGTLYKDGINEKQRYAYSCRNKSSAEP